MPATLAHVHICVPSRFIHAWLCATPWRDITCIPCISCVPDGLFNIEPPGKPKRTYNQYLFCWKPSWWRESLQVLTKQFHQCCKIIQVTDSIQKWLLLGVRCRKPLQLHCWLVQKPAIAYERPWHLQLTLAGVKANFLIFPWKTTC